MLAYRNIKTNTGSETKGTDNITIKDIAETTSKEFIKDIQNKLKNYSPQEVRRVYIPKPNGTLRPLGIPTIQDRIIQQAIKQILEPILEAKFYGNSYGFRPNRATHHAIAELSKKIHLSNLHYIVDIDIKGFFDNVNHSKLIKQLWTLGIRDKNLICVISKMLKAPIENEDIPEKGTPQGGILSPLLSNVVLNELDWWIASQWEEIPTKHNYNQTRVLKGKNVVTRGNKYRALRTTNLKEVFIVRYADDFKIVCRDYKTAKIMFQAVKNWLKERLKLDISEEKSKITNLRTRSTEFLGFELGTRKKRNKLVVTSRMTKKAKINAINKLKYRIRQIQKNPNGTNVQRFNSTVLGLQNYYKIATLVSNDFAEIHHRTFITLHNRLKERINNRGDPGLTYKRLYSNYSAKPKFVNNRVIFPIYGICHSKPLSLQRDINDYTVEGRKIIHENIKGIESQTIRFLLNNPISNRSTEYNDNRMSLYVGQNGKCRVTKQILDPKNMECHHIEPMHRGGDDSYNNLILLKKEVHRLIHMTNQELIKDLVDKLALDDKEITAINKFREKIGNYNI